MTDQSRNPALRTFLVDGDQTFRQTRARALTARGQEVLTAADHPAVAGSEVDAALVEVGLGTESGLDIVRWRFRGPA